MAKATGKAKQRQQDAEGDEFADEVTMSNIMSAISDFENDDFDEEEDEDDEFLKQMQLQEAQILKQKMLAAQKLAESKEKSAQKAQANVQQFASMVKKRREKQLKQWSAKISQINESFEYRNATVSSIVTSLLFPNGNISDTAPPTRTSNQLYVYQQSLFSESEKLIASAKALLARQQELQRAAQALEVCEVDAGKAQEHADEMNEAAKERICEILFDGDEDESGVRTVGWYEAARVVEESVGGALSGLPELGVCGMDVD